MAKEAGAGLAKFQLFDAEDDRDKPHYDWVKAHELTFDQAKMLFDFGASIGMEVFFSVFGVKYVEWCERIGVKRYKIACGVTDDKLLAAVDRTHKPQIRSSTTLYGWNHNITRLYCIPEYPCPLNHIRFPEFRANVINRAEGFSDHTIGLDAARIVLARGARIVEKHFILDRSIPAPDAPWSMMPDELRELVRFEKICQEVL